MERSEDDPCLPDATRGGVTSRTFVTGVFSPSCLETTSFKDLLPPMPHTSHLVALATHSQLYSTYQDTLPSPTEPDNDAPVIVQALSRTLSALSPERSQSFTRQEDALLSLVSRLLSYANSCDWIGTGMIAENTFQLMSKSLDPRISHCFFQTLLIDRLAFTLRSDDVNMSVYQDPVDPALLPPPDGGLLQRYWDSVNNWPDAVKACVDAHRFIQERETASTSMAVSNPNDPTAITIRLFEALAVTKVKSLAEHVRGNVAHTALAVRMLILVSQITV